MTALCLDGVASSQPSDWLAKQVLRHFWVALEDQPWTSCVMTVAKFTGSDVARSAETATLSPRKWLSSLSHAARGIEREHDVTYSFTSAT
jgi:hypothetical protein